MDGTSISSKPDDCSSSTVYMSAAVNQCRKAMVCCPVTGLLVYGAASRLLCYCPKSGRVVGCSREASRGNVTCVRCVLGATTPLYFAAYTSGDVALWELQQHQCNTATGAVGNMLVRRVHMKGGAGGSVSSGDCVLLSGGGGSIVVVATGGLDQHINITTASLSTGDVLSTQTISLRSRSLILELRLLQQQFPPPVVIPPTCDLAPPLTTARDNAMPLLLYGGDDSKLHIFAPKQDDSNMQKQQALEKHETDGKIHAPAPYEEVAVLPGHQDWVTAIDAITLRNGDVMVASGSKDGGIRVWRLQLRDNMSVETSSMKQDLVSSTASQLRVKPVRLRGDKGQAVLETVLCGHDGWLAHVSWLNLPDYTPCERSLRLVSCAQTEDRAIIVWQPQYYDSNVASNGNSSSTPPQETNYDENEEEVWVEAARLGEVGGNREGFYSAMFSPDGTAVYGHSYQGGLHHWNYEGDSTATSGGTSGVWQPQPTASGHFMPVVDLSWEATAGRYLLTTSLDQTTRLHAPVMDAHTKQGVWHEVCRPQVHGYDMSCVASVGVASFVAGAEEKLLRAFAAPTQLLDRLARLCEWGHIAEIEGREFVEEAAVPSLGLSNKSVADQQQEAMPKFTESRLTEDSLMAGSLWPEVCKLYGHGHELVCTAATAHHIATACRATAPPDAAVIIWSAASWQQLQVLAHHRLTVTQLCFTAHGDKLLTVSRARTWAVYQRQLHQDVPFALLSHSGLAEAAEQHSRIIWAADWITNADIFLTASRDKTVAVWGPADPASTNDSTGQQESTVGTSSEELQPWKTRFTLKEPDEVTAVAVSAVQNAWIIATGLSCGRVRVHVFRSCIGVPGTAVTHELFPSHHSTVRRLAFRPEASPSPTASDGTAHSQEQPLLLASCGNDNLACIYDCSRFVRE
uniref:Elongator complex protein 2 n=1 Tax=Hirondellea gigas TaxID=1518452 RepID=A0A2P2HZW5_9CRUS